MSAGLVRIARAGTNHVVVTSAGNIRVGNFIRVFDCQNREENLHRVTNISRDGANSRITFEGNLQHDYAQNLNEAGGHVGREGAQGARIDDIYLAESNELDLMLRDSYVERKQLSAGGQYVAPTGTLLNTFLQCFFNNNSRRNYFYTLGSDQLTAPPYRNGITKSPSRACAIFIKTIEGREEGPVKQSLLIRDVVCHETLHIFDTDIGEDISKAEDARRAWDNSDGCIMNIVGHNAYDGIYRMCLWHVYKIRDYEDGFTVTFPE